MSLRTKLLLTFLAISVAGTLITALIVSRSNERAVDQLLQDQALTNFVNQAQVYYQINGSWADVDRALRNGTPNAAAVPAGADGALPPPFALVGANGRIVMPVGPFRMGDRIADPVLAEGTAVLVNGVQVGTALVASQPPRNPEEELFVQQTNQALLIGALGATAVAVLLAVVLARTLTRPLQELSAASRQMAQGDLQQQVPVRSQDELGNLAATFNTMSAELARANQQRRQMTADIAHDLRTPLTVLSGYLEAMADGTLSPTPARLALMHDEVRVLTRLVADLRTLSLADAGQLVLQREPVDVDELLTAVQRAYHQQAAAQNVTVVVSVPAGLPSTELDPARMRQVLGNLVSNALRYTPAGGTITLAAAAVAAGMQLTISDTGSGIPAADLPHIFDRFYRGDQSRTEGQGESGLGLAIVRSLVAAHGGTLAVESTLGEGTTFAMTMPLVG